jgi:SWI/SNF-related matrix-associated actin-dependent regulator of chromatin subfamily A-like protein 1
VQIAPPFASAGIEFPARLAATAALRYWHTVPITNGENIPSRARTIFGKCQTRNESSFGKTDKLTQRPMSLFSKLFQRKPTAVASTEKPVQSMAQPAVQPSRAQARPQLTWTGFRYEFRCETGQGGHARQAGFHHDYQNNVYWSGLDEVARKVSQYADARAEQKLNAVDQQVALSMAVNASIEIPCPPGLQFLPFQKAGIAYALQRQNTLIADEMGLGKTVQAIGVCNASPNIRKILVICPAGLLLNWGLEMKKWMTRKLTIEYGSSTKLPNSDVVLVNYEIVGKLRDRILESHWDLHIYDESHYMKNPDAKRTMAVLGYEDTREIKNCRPLEAGRRLFLTGTPILNRPVELWPMLRVIDPKGLGANFWLFAQRFCRPFGQDFSGASNLDVLQERLRASVMVRRLKKDVLTELPPKRRQIVAMPSTAVKSIVDKEMNFYVTNRAMIEEAAAKAEIAQKEGDKESYDAAARDLKGLRQAAFEEISRLRHDTAVAKVPYLIDYLKNALEQENKIVLFAHHQDVINPIVNKFTSVAVKFDGTMSSDHKQQSVDRFQRDPKCKLFVGSITAAGVGITLTAASYVLFAELDWRPAMLAQAEDRLHRIGQKESVLVQHVVFDGSLDANMAKKIVEKQEIIDKAIG